MKSDFARCPGKTANGSPCRVTSNLNPATGECFWHDESRRAKAAEARSKGGAVSAAKKKGARVAKPESLPPFKPDSLERVALWHQWAVDAAATGEIDARTSDSICRHLKELRPTIEKVDMEKRFKEAMKKLALYEKGGHS
jgi:hypothetical protein